MNKLHLKYPLIVEGKYDKLKLSNIVSSPIIQLGGFSVINDSKKKNYIKTLASSTKLIILTDSDKAGEFIRSKLKGIVPKEKLINLYTPKINGKEKRKSSPSKEGILGIEGIDSQILFDILSPYASDLPQVIPVTSGMLWSAGLSGKSDSAEKRKILSKELSLPDNLTSKGLIDGINAIGGAELFAKAVKKLWDLTLEITSE